MIGKSVLYKILILVLFGIFGVAAMAGCDVSNTHEETVDSSLSSPDDPEEPVVISRGDDTVQSPSDSGDLPVVGGSDW